MVSGLNLMKLVRLKLETYKDNQLDKNSHYFGNGNMIKIIP